MILPSLFIAGTREKGRGVFTAEDIAKKTVIEMSPVIVMPKNERVLIDKTLLYYYIFEWGPKRDKCCMALGYVPMYNHSYNSNCEYEMDYDHEYMVIRTVRAVKAGDELTINYNGKWNDQTKMWFDVKD
jgi:SET domain-containing protein